MDKPYTIVGVDIGTTTAIAVFDLKSNLIYVDSKKGFSLSEVIKQILKYGKPVIIATDKKKSPSGIAKLAASFNCILFRPDHDLAIDEKDKLVKIYVKSEHERDAMASAIFAYKFYAPQFSNIDKNLESLALSDFSDIVKEMILTKKAKNISEAIEKIKPREEPKSEERIIKTETNLDWKNDAENLKKKLTSLQKSYDILRTYADKMAEKARAIERQKMQLLDENVAKSESARKEVMKEKEIQARDILIKQLQFETEKLKDESIAYRQRVMRETELDDIRNRGYLPIMAIENFDREDLLKSHKTYGITNKIIWVKNFKKSKQALKTLESFKPKIVIGKLDAEASDFLRERGIHVMENLPIKTGKYFAYAYPDEVESLLKQTEKRSFLEWLQDYKRRYD